MLVYILHMLCDISLGGASAPARTDMVYMLHMLCEISLNVSSSAGVYFAHAVRNLA